MKAQFIGPGIMEAKKCEIITAGMKCSWTAIINGGVARITGTVASVPPDRSWPFDVRGKAPDGTVYTGRVYAGDRSFEIYPE